MDFTPEKKKKITRWIIGVVAVCILLFLGVQHIGTIAKGLSWCLDIVMPLIVGFAFALILNVPMEYLERNLFKNSKKKIWCKVRRPIAFMLAVIFVVGILIGVVAIIVPSLVEAVTLIVRISIEWVNKLDSMSSEEISELPFGQFLQDVNWSNLLKSAKSWLADRAHVLPNAVFGTVTSLVSSITDLFVSVVFGAYVLFSKEKIKNRVAHLVRVWFPQNIGEWCCHAASIAGVNFKNFIFGQFFESVITGVLCFIGMLIFRFPYAAMISVLVGVTAFIPVIGGLIGGIIGALMIVTVDPIKALWFIVFLLIMQQTEGNVIYPKLMGTKVHLPGIMILAAVTIGGGIGGSVGMLLSVPIASTAYTLFKEATQKRELALKENNMR